MKDPQRFVTVLGALEVLFGLVFFFSSYQLHKVQMKSCKSHLLTRGLKPSGTSEGERSQTAMKNTTIRGEKYWNVPEAVETMAGRHRDGKGKRAPSGVSRGWSTSGNTHPRATGRANCPGWCLAGWEQRFKKEKNPKPPPKKKKSAKFWSFATCFRLPQLTQVNLDVLKPGSLILTV